jgi:hypothetical protein
MAIFTLLEPMESRRLFAASLVHQELHRPPVQAVGDLNGDGLADLARITVEATGDRNPSSALRFGIDTYLNDGTGTLTLASHVDYKAGEGRLQVPDSIVIADLDRDGALDVAMRVIPVPWVATAPDVPHASLVFFAGSGKGDLQQRGSFVLPHALETNDRRWDTDPYAETTMRLATGDVTGDKIDDFISVRDNEVVVVTMSERGPRMSTALQLNKVTVRGWDPKVKKVIVGRADLSRDGRADLIVTIGDGLHFITFDVDADGSPMLGKISKVEALTIRQTARVAVGDLDGDGQTDDLAILDGNRSLLAFNHAESGGGFKIESFPISNNVSDEILIGDTDGNGVDNLFYVLKTKHDTAKNSINNVR